MKTGIGLVLACAIVAMPLPSPGAPHAVAGEVPEVGIREKLGTTIPLDEKLLDEDGQSVTLRSLFDKPVLLLFVYFRCPAICRPLMHELARTMDKMDITAGKEFRVVTISFDPDETPDVAKTTKAEMFRSMQHPPPADGWRFLTTDEATIRRLTDATGFKYQYDPQTQSYLHASSLIFLTTGGKIVRYIGGLEFLPAQLKMAVIDATEGHERSFMHAVERLCYAYDPKGRTYVLKIDRLILGVSGVFVAGFLAFLFFHKRRKEV